MYPGVESPQELGNKKRDEKEDTGDNFGCAGCLSGGGAAQKLVRGKKVANKMKSPELCNMR
jgi:hypothetical protein